MVAFDAWGGSWGASWGLSWTGEHIPAPTPEPTPTPSGGAGSVGGRGGYSNAWRRELQRRLRRDEGHLSRRAETLKKPDDRAAAKRAADLAAKAIEQSDRLENIDFAERLAKALGMAAKAKKPAQLVTRAKEVEAASIALMEMLAEAMAKPPQHVITDDELAAILLLA